MILVNTPGSGAHVWWPLAHAQWHGFTPADLVFPAFLCAMGMALGLSFPRTIDAALWRRIAWRVFALIAIGWAWQMLARPGIETFRVFGVLPRLGRLAGRPQDQVLDAPSSPYSEALRRAFIALQLSRSASDAKVIMVTSATAGEAWRRGARLVKTDYVNLRTSSEYALAASMGAS